MNLGYAIVFIMTLAIFGCAYVIKGMIDDLAAMKTELRRQMEKVASVEWSLSQIKKETNVIHLRDRRAS